MSDELEEVFSIRQVAAAYHVTEETIRRWIKQGDIKYILVGPFRLKRLRPSDLIQEIDNGKTKNSKVTAGGNSTRENDKGTKTTGTRSDPLNS